MTTAPVAPRRRSPWHHRDFMGLWRADTISQPGTQVTGLAPPLVPILVLDATPSEAGLLGACEFAPFLPARRAAGGGPGRPPPPAPDPIAADVGRATLLAWIPVAHRAGVPTLVHLLVVAFATGVMTVPFERRHQSFLPSLVDPGTRWRATRGSRSRSRPDTSSARPAAAG